jgi:hypothetical protein
MYSHLKFMYLIWQFSIIDTYAMVNYFVNVGMQYITVVFTYAGVKHLSELNLKVMLEPITGLGISVRYIKAAETASTYRARVANIAALLSSSAGLTGTSTPAANGTLGCTIAIQIESMRAALTARGGGYYKNSLQLISQSSLENYQMICVSLETAVTKFHPYREKFAFKSKIIIDNLFQKHTTGRFLQKVDLPARYLIPLVSTELNTNLLILVGYTYFGFGVVSFIALGTLYLF